MTRNIDTANEWIVGEIFNVLSGLGHRVFMYDSTGARVFDPSEANRLFSASAKMMISLGATKGKPARPLVTFHTSDSTQPEVLDAVRTPLIKHNLHDHSFDIRPYGRTLEPKNFAHMNQSPVTESAWTGSTRTSRQMVGVTEVVIRHNQPLMDSEHARRWTRIRDIFIHATDGTRYRCPWKHLLGARALAQHMDHQGQPWDPAGQAVHTLVTALLQMRKLKNWCVSHRPDAVNHVVTLQHDIKHLLKQISDPRSYTSALDQAQQLSQTWTDNPPSDTSAWPGNLDQAVNMVHTHAPTGMLEFKESQSLDAWFDQFMIENIFGEQHTQAVADAITDTGSDDPRDILRSLTSRVTGWSSKFEQDPKGVLDSLMAAMDKIKKMS